MDKIRRRLDRLHLLLLLTITSLFSVLLFHSIIQRPIRQLPIKGSDNNRFVHYEKTTPLLWIGGIPRSGTTLMRAMLDAHPDIRCGEETRVVPRILGATNETLHPLKERTHMKEAGISESLVWSAVASYILTIIEGHGISAPLLCDKDPLNLKFIPNILDMFPESKFIMMIRDGRAVAHSIVSRQIGIADFDVKTYNGSLTDWSKVISRIYALCQRAGEDKCLPVYYERLVLDPKLQMKRILDFVDKPWDDAVLHHEKSIGQEGGISLSKIEPSTDQVNKSINHDALNTWATQLPVDILMQVNQLAPVLAQLGYQTDKLPMNYSTDLDPILERGFISLNKT